MIMLNNVTVNFKDFPNGESFADVSVAELNCDLNSIQVKFENDKDLLYLLFLKDFIDDNYPKSTVILQMAYIPYSRMDRKEENRLFTLKSFARMVNRMGFDSVEVMEPHSEVSVGLIDRVHVINKSAELALIAMRDALGLKGCAWFDDSSDREGHNLQGLFKAAEEAGIYLVYPDAGAEKRYKKQIKYAKVLTCSKERDFNTGNIKSIFVNGAENAQDCKIAIIVDDLCSKGGTFVGSAIALKEGIPSLITVILCVAHCENTIYEGKILSEDIIDKVYTTDSIFTISPNRMSEVADGKLVVDYIY